MQSQRSSSQGDNLVTETSLAHGCSVFDSTEALLQGTMVVLKVIGGGDFLFSCHCMDVAHSTQNH
jgi:hypothetical protein